MLFGRHLEKWRAGNPLQVLEVYIPVLAVVLRDLAEQGIDCLVGIQLGQVLLGDPCLEQSLLIDFLLLHDVGESGHVDSTCLKGLPRGFHLSFGRQLWLLLYYLPKRDIAYLLGQSQALYWRL